PPPGDLRIPTFQPSRPRPRVRRRNVGIGPARRLGRAIDWLNLAWLNASRLSDDLRVPALRAGFEVLRDSDDSETLARRLSSLNRRLVDHPPPQVDVGDDGRGEVGEHARRRMAVHEVLVPAQ